MAEGNGGSSPPPSAPETDSEAVEVSMRTHPGEGKTGDGGEGGGADARGSGPAAEVTAEALHSAKNGTDSGGAAATKAAGAPRAVAVDGESKGRGEGDGGDAEAKARDGEGDAKQHEERSPKSPTFRVVVVTGAGMGTGAELTKRLVRLGKRVLAVDSRAELLEAVAKQCAAQQPVGELIPVVADVSTAEGRTVVLNTVLERRFTIMGLILIHGALSKASHVAALDNSEYSRVMAVNVEGPLFLTQSLLPHIYRHGRITCMASGLSSRAMPGAATYCASMHAFRGAFACLKAELDGEKHRHPLVGFVRPGPLDTPMQSVLQAAEAAGGEELSAGMATIIDLKRTGTKLNLTSGDAPHALTPVHLPAMEKALEDPQNSARFISWAVLGCSSYMFTKSELDPRNVEVWELWQEWERKVEDALDAVARERANGGKGHAALDPIRSPTRDGSPGPDRGLDAFPDSKLAEELAPVHEGRAMAGDEPSAAAASKSAKGTA